jgi:hypothetical protein
MAAGVNRAFSAGPLFILLNPGASPQATSETASSTLTAYDKGTGLLAAPEPSVGGR